MPSIGRRGHVRGLFTVLGHARAALGREIWPSDQDLETWLADLDPFP
jgi:hypothetical protein